MELLTLVDALEQIKDKHPTIMLGQHEKRWKIDTLIKLVQEDIRVGGKGAEFLTESQFYWGYDVNGKVSVAQSSPRGVSLLFHEAGAGGPYHETDTAVEFVSPGRDQ